MIERNFDIPFIANLALREKQIQQNYRPIIAVHKWFARRPGTLFRGLLLSEFSDSPLRHTYYQANDLKGCRVADPFMGGGTPLLEANRVGCDVIGYDINPMAYWIVKQEIEHLDLAAYRNGAEKFLNTLTEKIGSLYRTACRECGSPEARVKYFLWVKMIDCRRCGKDIDLFPGHLIAKDTRHPGNVFVCPECGNLTETTDRRNPGRCLSCKTVLSLKGPAKRNHCLCPECGEANTYPRPGSGPPRHRMFAIEYHCPECKPRHQGRFFKAPDDADLADYNRAADEFRQLRSEYVPDAEIPTGDETNLLHRWGYRRYSEMFNKRQLLGLELSCRLIMREKDERVRQALATNLSDLLRYQNMLCRYDTMALKSLDIFSVHGFPVGLIQCESNFLGIRNQGKQTNVGSGGWANIINKFIKAKSYGDEPFEFRHDGRKKSKVMIPGEWIGESRNSSTPRTAGRKIELFCANAVEKNLAPNSLDGVFTDPPYFGNVQYAELMDFCYVWLRQLAGKNNRPFLAASTRNSNELTGNVDMGRGLEHFTKGISATFQHMAKALKPGAPLAFTYRHNKLSAYFPLAVAILDAGLTCSASLPCPAEMGASIHINGTGSSIIDTVFVCRSTGTVPRNRLADSPAEVADLVAQDLRQLRLGNVKPTQGDRRCITFGHLIRLAIWSLRNDWQKEQPTSRRMAAVEQWLNDFGGLAAVENCQADRPEDTPLFQAVMTGENEPQYGSDHAEVSF